MYINSDRLLKSLLLTWDNIKTIVPQSHKNYIDMYLSGHIKNETNIALETYKQIYDAAGERVIDFLVIKKKERERASDQMFDLIANWNKDTGFYDSLKINSINDLVGKWVEWYWFFHEKIEQDLVELMLEEKLVVNWAPGEIVGYKKVGKSYMSIIADEIKRSRKVRLVTDDEFYMATKAGLHLHRVSEETKNDQYQIVTLAIPKVFINDAILDKLNWKDIINIRRDLLPFSIPYYKEIEEYQNSINLLVHEGKDNEAFNKFCEFCERVAISFKPFSKEVGKILRKVTQTDAVGLLNGIILPSIKLLKPDPYFTKLCDTISISSTIGKYSLTKKHGLLGFEYLENLNRAINIKRLKKTLTCIIPKKIQG